jgi:hypothetical protein
MVIKYLGELQSDIRKQVMFFYLNTIGKECVHAQYIEFYNKRGGQVVQKNITTKEISTRVKRRKGKRKM